MKKIDINGQNLDLTNAIRDYVNKKVERSLKHSIDNVSHVRINLSCEPKTGTHLVETIVFLHGGKTLHNKTRSEDMYASVDIACASIERQMRKAKEKSIDVGRYKSFESKINELPESISAIAS